LLEVVVKLHALYLSVMDGVVFSITFRPLSNWKNSPLITETKEMKKT
jgi:hypothetical protein